MQINAKIKYKCKPTHPDIEGLTADKEYEYSDTYYIDPNYFDNDMEQIEAYIRHDLLLIAGGGYGWEHIYDYSFDIKEV